MLVRRDENGLRDGFLWNAEDSGTLEQVGTC